MGGRICEKSIFQAIFFLLFPNVKGVYANSDPFEFAFHQDEVSVCLHICIKIYRITWNDKKNKTRILYGTIFQYVCWHSQDI